MDASLFLVIGGAMIVLVLIIPLFLRDQNDRDLCHDLQEALKERGKKAVLKELDEKIDDQLTQIAKLEANAGMMFGGGGDDTLHMEHRELRRLYRCRDIAGDYPEDRHEKTAP